jgi:glycosyltransferase involved in cell wall biosynthesis
MSKKDEACAVGLFCRGRAVAEMPLVSIVIPVYNTAKYLARCLDSVLSQSHEALDILVVDDGSTDASGAMADAYAAKDARMRVFHTANGGLSAARNLGIEQAKGDYLAFVDSDDRLLPDAIALQVAAMQAQQLQVVCCGIQMEKSNGRVVPLRIADPAAQQVQTGLSFLAGYYPKHFNIIITAWATLFDTAFVRTSDVRFPVGLFREDNYFSICLFFQAQRVAYLDCPAYFYAFNPSSITADQEKYTKQCRDVVLICHMLEEKINALPDPQYQKHFHHIFAKYYMAFGGDWKLLKSPYHSVIQPGYVSGKSQTALARAQTWLFSHHLPVYAILQYAALRAIRLFIKER